MVTPFIAITNREETVLFSKSKKTGRSTNMNEVNMTWTRMPVLRKWHQLGVVIQW